MSRLNKKYAIVQREQGDTGDNNLVCANADLASYIKTGLGSGQVFIELVFQSEKANAKFPVALGDGSDNTEMSIVFKRGGSLTMDLVVANGAAAETIIGPILRRGSSMRHAWYVEFSGSKNSYCMDNGEFVSSDTLSNAYDYNGITSDLTLCNRADGPTENGQFTGMIYSVKFWYLPSTLTQAQASQAAKDLRDTGTSSLLTGQVIHIEPDETDLAALTSVRNRITAYPFGASNDAMTYGSHLDCTLSQIAGVEEKAWFTRGLDGGSLTYMRTSNDSAFDPVNCIWEALVSCNTITTTEKVIMGDDNNTLSLIETGGNDLVRFTSDRAGTATVVNSQVAIPALDDTIMHVAAICDGTDQNVALNGIEGTAVTDDASMVSSGAFGLMGHGSSGDLPCRGVMFGARVLQFTTMPDADEITQILRYQSINWPNLHPIVNNMLRLGTAKLVEWTGNNISEPTDGNYVWASRTQNHVTTSHDLTGLTGVSDQSFFIGSTIRGKQLLYVGDPAGTTDANGVKGTALNPYQGATAIADVITDTLMTASEIQLGDYTYSEGLDPALAGEGQRRIKILGSQSCQIADVNFAANGYMSLIGNGMHVVSAGGGGYTLRGTAVGLTVAGTVVRGATGGGGGINLTNNYCAVHGCTVVDNAGSIAISLTGVRGIATSNIGSDSTSALTGAATTITDYNCWNGTVVTATAGGYDLVGYPPLFNDAAANDYTLQIRSHLIHSGELLSGYNKSWDLGAMKYTGYRVFRLGNFNIVKG